MSKALGNSWIVIVVSAAMLLVVAAACSAETSRSPVRPWWSKRKSSKR